MKPELGVCYYPEHWPETMWQTDAARMRDAGISWVRIGEFAWSRLEPAEGKFQWDWLDRAIDMLGNAGLQIVMGTPSATPPRWMLTKFSDMLAVDITGQPRKFGSRRHYCFSHLPYREAAARMAGAMAKRYGGNPHIQAWQLDNEYGCHDTILSYSPAALQEFRRWLLAKYQTPDRLNQAWGNIFWSMEYSHFDEIELPNLTVTEANPSHWLDFYRFSSDQTVAFNQAQAQAVRQYTTQPLIHNYMGRVTDFDHFKLGDDLDIASWDSYPMGFLEQVLHEESEDWKAAFARQGDPDFQAFHHDLYRAVGKGRWWVMEQQPGPVNWAPYNPIPLPGMVKLWTMEAVAHGAEVVSYFRWRQAPFAQEQMHAGLLRPDSSAAEALAEAQEAHQELKALGDITQQPADIAILFDYESQWAGEIQPQGQGFDYFRLVFEQYRALRKLGLSIDILPAQKPDLKGQKLILIPGLLCWNEALRDALTRFDGLVLAGPRTGLKSADMQIPPGLGPDFAAATTERVASLRPNVSLPLAKGGAVINWFEQMTCEQGEEPLADNPSATLLARAGKHLYLGGWLDQSAYLRLFQHLCAEAAIPTRELPEGVRCRAVAGREFIANYNAHPVRYDGVDLAPGAYSWR